MSLSNNTNIFRELLVNNTALFYRVYVKQYWHFQREPSKLNYSKSFQSSCHTILTLPEGGSEGVGGRVFTMKNKDANTDYQKVVRVGDQKWEIVEFTIGINFFVWDLYSLLFVKQGQI